MNSARNPDGTLFLYGHDHIWTWGLYRYEAQADIEWPAWAFLWTASTSIVTRQPG